jgi:hypothetical protein
LVFAQLSFKIKYSHFRYQAFAAISKAEIFVTKVALPPIRLGASVLQFGFCDIEIGKSAKGMIFGDLAM